MKNKKSINDMILPGVYPICFASGIIAIVLLQFCKTLLWPAFFIGIMAFCVVILFIETITRPIEIRKRNKEKDNE